MFVARWHQNKGESTPEGGACSAAAIDATLESAPAALSSLVPATYALLRSSPLSPVLGASRSDRTQALGSLWASLAPPELMRSIYPLFVAIEDMEEVWCLCSDMGSETSNLRPFHWTCAHAQESSVWRSS